MTRNWKQIGLMPLLAAALWLAGCSDQGSPLAPVQQPVAQGPSESLSLKDDLAAIMEGEAPDLSARSNEAIIGPQGGVLYVSLHYLYVPKGAVKKPTLFRMELPTDGRIGASLTATSVGSSKTNDVGSSGFKKPVYLTFSYAYATNPPSNPEQLKIFWEKKNGRLEAQPTTVHPWWKAATGELRHFSDYILAMP